MIKKILILSSACVISTGCVRGLQNVKFLKPLGRVFSYVPEKADPVYKLAWDQGCETGLSTGGFSRHLYRTFYQYQKDIRFLGFEYGDDRDLFNGRKITERDKRIYNRVWYSSFKGCRHYVLSTFKPNSPQNQGEALGKLDDLSMLIELNQWGSSGKTNFTYW